MHCAHRRPERHVGARHAWRSRARARGFTLIELIAVIVILGSLAAVAVPTFLDLRRDAHNRAHVAIGAAFFTGVQSARAAWHIAPNGGAAVSALNHSFGGGQASFTAQGQLTGSNNAAGTLSDARCLEIWRIAVANAPAIEIGIDGTPGTGYTTRLDPLGFCVYAKLGADGTRLVTVPAGNIVYIGYDPLGAYFAVGRVWAVDITSATWFN